MKKLKIFNGGGWNYNDSDHIYIAAYSWNDAVNIANEAYRKERNLTDRNDVKWFKLHYARAYWSAGCWGIAMNGIVPERGLWRSENRTSPVKRII